MWHWCWKAHWNSNSHLPKDKEKKHENLMSNTKRRVLGNISSPICQQMADNSLQMKRILQATKIWFYSRILRITWRKNANKEVLWKMETTRTCIHQIRKIYLKFLRKENLENITLTQHTESKRDIGKQQIIYLTSFCKCTAEQRDRGIVKGQSLLRTTQCRKVVVGHNHPHHKKTWHTQEEQQIHEFILYSLYIFSY